MTFDPIIVSPFEPAPLTDDASGGSASGVPPVSAPLSDSTKIPVRKAVTPAPPVPPQPAVPRIDPWQAAAGQKETTARLARLPAGVEFGEGYPEPIRYDVARRVLVYRGFMPSGSYADLRRVSNDAAYLAALDALYVGTSLRAGAGRGRRLLVVAALAAVAVGALVWRLLLN